MVYLDAVLDQDFQPIFNNTPEEVTNWLKENPSTEKRWVCVGRSLRFVTPEDYLKGRD